MANLLEVGRAQLQRRHATGDPFLAGLFGDLFAEGPEFVLQVLGLVQVVVEGGLGADRLARLVGVDEAGRGPLAGPVVAAACALPPRADVPGIDGA